MVAERRRVVKTLYYRITIAGDEIRISACREVVVILVAKEHTMWNHTVERKSASERLQDVLGIVTTYILESKIFITAIFS
jgi:hypothetical protein